MKKSLIYYKEKASRHIKYLIVDKDEETESLQEQLKKLKLEKDGLQALLDISESDTVTTFESGSYVNGIREIYIKLLGMNVGWNNVYPIIEPVLEHFSSNNREFICRRPNTGKNSSSNDNCRKFQLCIRV